MHGFELMKRYYTSLHVARVALFSSDPTPFRARQPVRRRTSPRRNLTAPAIQVSQFAVLVPHYFPPLFIFREVNLSLRKLISPSLSHQRSLDIQHVNEQHRGRGVRDKAPFRKVPYPSVANKYMLVRESLASRQPCFSPRTRPTRSP